MSELKPQPRCEIESKPYRMYYKDDWRCDCIEHTQEIYQRILNNTFETKDAQFYEYSTWNNEQDAYYSVSTKKEYIDIVMLRTLEYHGLMLRGIYNDQNKITFHFSATGFFGDEPITSLTDGENE